MDSAISGGVDFVGHVIKPGYRTTRRRTVNEAMARTAGIDAAELFATANSYFGLLGQSSTVASFAIDISPPLIALSILSSPGWATCGVIGLQPTSTRVTNKQNIGNCFILFSPIGR